MTTDRQYCLGDHEKLLRDYCLPAVDACLHLGGTRSADKIDVGEKKMNMTRSNYDVCIHGRETIYGL